MGSNPGYLLKSFLLYFTLQLLFKKFQKLLRFPNALFWNTWGAFMRMPLVHCTLSWNYYWRFILIFWNLKKQPYCNILWRMNINTPSERISTHWVLSISLKIVKNFRSVTLMYSEVPNIRADRNKRAGLEKSATLLACLFTK